MTIIPAEMTKVSDTQLLSSFKIPDALASLLNHLYCALTTVIRGARSVPPHPPQRLNVQSLRFLVALSSERYGPWCQEQNLKF